MTECIDREAAIKALCERSEPCFTESGEPTFKGDYIGAIASVPAADVVEARHGRWIRTDGIAHGIVSRVCSCSLCKRNAGVSENGFWYLSDYCPNCGADMREV